MQPLIERIYEVMQANNDLFTEAGLEPVRTIDLYRGQPLNPEAFEMYEIPAIFLAWRIKWTRNGRIKEGAGELDVHIVTDAPWGTGNIFTGYENALKQVFGYEVIDNILQGLESTVTGKLDLVDERPVDTGVICYQVNTYSFTKRKAVLTPTTIQVGADATLEIKGKLVKKID